ncbi:putative reverse transcriptase domain-containing protein, partial [Tanacetum coccineum]
IHPYEEVDPLNPPPPSSDFKPEDVIVPTSRSTLQLLPPIRRFSGNFYVREGSSSDAFVANHHRGMKEFDYDLTRLDSMLRDEIRCHSQMEQMRPYDATAIPVAQVIADDPYIPAATNDPAAQGNAEGPASGTGGPAGAPAVWECSFGGYMKCSPTSFHRTKGAVELCQALTWWNSQVATLGLENANQTTWNELKRLMTEEFCPAEEIQRMEHAMWNLKVKDFNISAYTSCFNELVLLCPTMVLTERKKIKAYIRGLSDNIKGEVTSSKLANLNEAVQMAHTLMEQK